MAVSADLDRTIKRAINKVKFALYMSRDATLRVTLEEANQKLYLALGMIRDGKE
jgi:hypothetical protein